MIKKLVSRPRRCAINPHLPPAIFVGIKASADFYGPIHAVQFGKDAKSAGVAVASPNQIHIGSPAHAATRCKQRQRFHQVGFARAIIAGQHHVAVIESKVSSGVITKPGQLQPAYMHFGPRLSGTGKSPAIANL